MTEFISWIRQDKMAVYEVPANPLDRLTPMDNPKAFWDKIRFHSDFQYLSKQTRYNGISVTHAAIAGVTGTGYIAPGTGSSLSAPVANGQFGVATHTLVTHGLGYVPLFQIIWNGNIISPGTVIQTVANDKSRVRIVSPYATTSIIGLKSIGISSTLALPSTSVAYDVIVFREPAVDPSLPMVRLSPSAGKFVLGKGRITSDNLPLRRWVSGDPILFYQPVERTTDIRNGAFRNINQAGAADYGTYTGAFFTTGLIRVTDDG